MEYYDRNLYIWVKDDPKHRFELIRKDERTILTTLGPITYKRRYYRDKFDNKYVYLLDNQLGIPPNIRMSNELIIKILDLASSMTYSEVGKRAAEGCVLSKFTIWNTIKNVNIEAIYFKNINRGDLKVHLQVDEKYVGMIDSKNKKKYYTATIFAGKIASKLQNKTVLSAATLPKIRKLINYHLKERYKVDINEEIFVSGDMALYVQNFKNHIYCRAKYVPDKFHVYKVIKDDIPDLLIDKYSINDENVQRYLLKNLKKDNSNSRKVIKILKKKPELFKTYLDYEYLGCSQEGQNSHIYAPRFGKYANRFSPSTIEKLSIVREAISLDINIEINYLNREIPEILDIGYLSIDLESPFRYALDTRGMSFQSAKMFEAIKDGKGVKWLWLTKVGLPTKLKRYLYRPYSRYIIYNLKTQNRLSLKVIIESK